MTKREMILDAALTLFSEKGYDGVGVDEIADKVGMKGPALYYYFKGKEALLNGLLDAMTEHYAANFGSADRIRRYPETLEELAEMSLKRLEFTLHDPMIKKTRKLLIMEQFRNDRCRQMTTYHTCVAVEAMNTVFFRHLLELGKVKKMDPELLAFEFTAPVSILIQLVDREPEKEPEVWEKIRAHMEHFIQEYGI
ncbi:MAG: helix-turn-helix domain-containing protein [Lachnospiraceae bacterium]|nr:helix-turn-helix domain-containing protein [Lachnospiraceae bacterium]